MQRQPFTVNARKYDLTLRRSWQAELVEFTGSHLKLVGEFSDDVEHSDLGYIPAGTISHETFPFNAWFNYFTFFELNGSLRNHYFNICLPPEIREATIDYVDLDIDIVIWPDSRIDVLDLEEFEANVRQFGYPDNVTQKAKSTADEIQNRWYDIIYSQNNDAFP